MTTLRWIVTGAGGMLGHDVMVALREAGHEVVGLGRGDLDITDADAVRAAFDRHRPDVVVNCAAYTAVDDAETDEERAYQVNAVGPRLLAEAAAAHGTRLVHVSTDYVFAGDARAPYAEDAKPAPATAYGRTKLAGEEAVLDTLPTTGVVVRTAWLYGAHGGNFVRTMMRLERERDTLEVVDDQRGQPTWTVDVAERLVLLGADPRAAGIFHATSAGEATWYELAREVFRLLGADPDRVRPTTTDRFPRPAPRPAYSVLGHARWAELGLGPIRHWREALHAAFPTLPRP
ncbi:dTDP-4-dehydrorhamnose reductase [Thermasporomyces composti]|jgi:dTDP-4-dehydrorhamnose reductase|uniref:dTDP-4-dehydrorhamnose reductase n=1 Tax=Thermasporomyces composti TaxID=696763 RepID=A0A3D9V302_THECX|nr:dTDP-4-dehydrorhamnose reductase [Thermasporomyces composti]REF35083.1 dTDP-4-dehydrorhamnose reductase [Thermasporomyces composti]